MERRIGTGLKRADLSRLELFEPYDVLMQTGLTPDEVAQARKELTALRKAKGKPAPLIGTYFMFVDGPPAGFPAKPARWMADGVDRNGTFHKAGDPFVAFAGPHINKFDTPEADAFAVSYVAQQTQGKSDFIMPDNSHPLRTSWAPGVDADADGDVDGIGSTYAIYQRSILSQMRALSKAFPGVSIVPNTGGRIREFSEFCACVNGPGIEDTHVRTLADGTRVHRIDFSPIDFTGASRTSPDPDGNGIGARLSLAFMGSEETYQQALAMPLPRHVVVMRARYLVLASAGIV